MKARGIVVASLTSGSPSSRAGLVTGNGMSPQCEPDQTPCEVSVCVPVRAHISQNHIRTPDNVKKERKLTGKEIKKKKTLDTDTF